eukprot:5853420-Pyramimonas_sp.AAC.1
MRAAGDRAMGLLSMMGRLWSLVRGPQARGWSRGHAASLDAAIEGATVACMRHISERSMRSWRAPCGC